MIKGISGMALMALIFQLTCNLNRYKESPEEYAHFLVRTSSTYLHMDNWYNSLGINCQARDYPIMDSICSYIEENIGSLPPFTADILKTGYLHMQVWEYNVYTNDFRDELTERINGYALPFSGDSVIDFDPDGDYIVELNFTFLDDSYAVFNWMCNGFRFSSMVFLNQYFDKITGIRQNGRPDHMFNLIQLLPDVYGKSVRAFFKVQNGEVVKSSLYKCEMDFEYSHGKALLQFLAD